jgi:hypothetical protein
MKKLKLILLVLLFFSVGFIYTENINAEMTDADCRACAEQNGGRCACYDCATNDAGECVANTNYDGADDAQKHKDMGGCSGYEYETSCEYNDYYSCIWNDNEYGEYCNTDKLIYVRCGDVFDIPQQAPAIISFIVNFLKIAAPIILIIVSIISLLKALAASSEDEIKKAQKSLIRKALAAVMVFFVISIVQFIILTVADTEKDSKGISEADNISTCLSCFLNNDCSGNAYYKTSVGGKYKCTYFSDKENPVNCD